MTQAKCREIEASSVATEILRSEPSVVRTVPMSESQKLSLLERLRTREAPLLATPKAHGD